MGCGHLDRQFAGETHALSGGERLTIIQQHCCREGVIAYAEAKSAITIPVIANGDIDSPELAKLVLEQTGADRMQLRRIGQ